MKIVVVMSTMTLNHVTIPSHTFNSQKNYNLLGLMQYTVIRLAIKSHFWDCVIWVTNICKYLYILCNSWPQILIHRSKKAFLMLPTLFWTYNFTMTASQNSPLIKFITQFVMWDFLNSKPIEQQQIKVSVYIAWIKINHMLKNTFLTLKRYLVSRTFDICRIHQLFYTSVSIWENTSRNISLSCQSVLIKKKKNLAAILLLPTSVVTHERDNPISGRSSQELIQSQTVTFNI